MFVMSAEEEENKQFYRPVASTSVYEQNKNEENYDGVEEGELLSYQGEIIDTKTVSAHLPYQSIQLGNSSQNYLFTAWKQQKAKHCFSTIRRDALYLFGAEHLNKDNLLQWLEHCSFKKLYHPECNSDALLCEFFDEAASRRALNVLSSERLDDRWWRSNKLLDKDGNKIAEIYIRYATEDDGYEPDSNLPEKYPTISTMITRVVALQERAVCIQTKSIRLTENSNSLTNNRPMMYKKESADKCNGIVEKTQATHHAFLRENRLHLVHKDAYWCKRLNEGGKSAGCLKAWGSLEDSLQMNVDERNHINDDMAECMNTTECRNTRFDNNNSNNYNNMNECNKRHRSRRRVVWNGNDNEDSMVIQIWSKSAQMYHQRSQPNGVPLFETVDATGRKVLRAVGSSPPYKRYCKETSKDMEHGKWSCLDKRIEDLSELQDDKMNEMEQTYIDEMEKKVNDENLLDRKSGRVRDHYRKQVLIKSFMEPAAYDADETRKQDHVNGSWRQISKKLSKSTTTIDPFNRLCYMDA